MLKTTIRRYRVLRTDRASLNVFVVGDIVWAGRDGYGCAGDDTRSTGIEHIAVSPNESGEPFYTIPRADVEIITS